MSGGHYDYFYSKLEEFAEIVCPEQDYTKEERIIARLCKDLSKLCYELEWWKSGDTSFEQFKKEYDKFNKKWIKIF